MMEDSFLSKSVAAHRERMIALYCDPQIEHFCERFGITLPDQLRRLYSLREKLFTTLNERRRAGDDDLIVRDFAPLSRAAIDYCEKYHFRFFSFGIGHDGEDLLVGFDSDRRTHVDWGEIAQLPRAIEVPFAQIVELIERHKQDRG